MKKKSLLIYLTALGIFFGATSCNDSGKGTDESSTDKDTTTKVAREIEGDWEGCVVGAYTFDVDGSVFPENAEQRVKELEELLGKKVGSIAWFPTWAQPFPLEECKRMEKIGCIPHLTWELFWPDSSHHSDQVDSTGYKAMDEILEGKHDEYLEKYADDAAKFGKRVFMRFMHEFNGNWYLWSGNKNGRENGGPAKVVAVWKYVVDKFKAAGADNVKWLWVPHGPSTDLSTEPWNNLSNYWPGDDYVDWIGLDAYNFYPKDPWGGIRPYRDFDNCFKAIYDSCVAMSDKPILIAEFGTGEFEYEGLTKADWVKEAFTKIKTEYTRVKLFTWFHIKKELDWRVHSSEGSLQAFKEAMKDPYFIGNPYTDNKE